MTRDEILAVVAKHIVEAGEGLTISSIDPARSMKDYDLHSLDIVEVVSRSMRTLNVTIPRAELKHLNNIDGLVDLLHRSVASRPQ